MISRGLLRCGITKELGKLRAFCSSSGGRYGRPSTVTWSKCLHNSVSFIGTVEYPPKQFATRNDHFGVYTFLRVNTPSASFTIMLEAWDELAQRVLLHLKPQHHIYVSGQLGSYTNLSQGLQKTTYKVLANEINYVKLDEPEKGVASSRKETGKYMGKCNSQIYSKRLHLWQIFFASPDEWYDNRRSKTDPRQPDFKHKSTDEVLWLNEYDPPWVHKQLELLDSKLIGPLMDESSSISSPSACLSVEHLAEPTPISSTNHWKFFK